MLLHIDSVLSAEEAAQYRDALDQADWVDGRVTAGYQSARAKHNLQLPEDHPLAVQLGERIVAVLQQNPLFMGAALPLRVFPPLFNRYDGGQSFHTHVDNAIRHVKGSGHPESTIDMDRMMKIVGDAGYKSWVGIEYEGTRLTEFEGIQGGKRCLERYL